MRVYLEPSVIVKLFKQEADSDKMIEVISKADEDPSWSTYTSGWSILEVARALKKDGKQKEIIELDLRELRSHKIKYKPVTKEVLAEAEKILTDRNIYASDSVHAATYRRLAQKSKMDAFLTDDRHFLRLRGLVRAKGLRDLV